MPFWSDRTFEQRAGAASLSLVGCEEGATRARFPLRRAVGIAQGSTQTVLRVTQACGVGADDVSAFSAAASHSQGAGGAHGKPHGDIQQMASRHCRADEALGVHICLYRLLKA